MIQHASKKRCRRSANCCPNRRPSLTGGCHPWLMTVIPSGLKTTVTPSGLNMSRVVREFYDSDVQREWRRLAEPLCQIEFASTLRLVEKYFPPTGRVCDIGGGPGRYTVALARRGYRVTLVELSDGLLKRVRQH
jgi:hypothetical protein